MDLPPAVVLLHVWGIPRHRIPGALLRMARTPRTLAATPGLRFAKTLGTGRPETFSPRHADPRHWALLTCWQEREPAVAFERSAAVRSWDRISEERLCLALQPLASRGRWSRQEPFGDPVPWRHDGPVAAITRARLTPHKIPTFWRAVPPVAADLSRTAGLRLALAIGEAPIGLQGTFSLWDSPRALRAFAAHGAPHQDAVRRTATEGWYAEELFARFAVLDVAGTFRGIRP